MTKRCLNEKQVSCIPPLFHDNKFKTDFKEKAELFSSFLSKQFFLINNDSKFPSNVVYHIPGKLSDIVFNSEEIT